MNKVNTISVRALAEFSLETGDLRPAAQMTERMNDGLLGHRKLQSILGRGWKAEKSVSRSECVEGVELHIQGRADAVRRDGDVLRVLEIKTTAGNPTLIGPEDYPAHFAQGEIYAYLICANEGISSAEVSLLYYNLDGRQQSHRRQYSFDALRQKFLRCAQPYAIWVAALDAWKAQSEPTLKTLKFPFPQYREGQKEMAKCVYRAMQGGQRALIEAPTGIGKTAAALFGALKALGKGKITALFYLTARTTGRRSAEQALEIMREQGLRLRSIVITAKEKCCLTQRAECFGCPYGIDYYERRRPALREALHIEAADAEMIQKLAMEYEICPHALSLDMSEQADVIICDYNYAFDPRVYLRRYFDQKSKAGLLVDEAHNLPDRARDMLSVELSGLRIEEIRQNVGRFEGRESPMYQALTALLRTLTRPEAEHEILDTPPVEVVRAARTFADIAGELGCADPEIAELVMDAIWFARVARQFDEKSYRTLILPEENRISVKLWCFDPSDHLKRVFSRVEGAALFSATLAPMNHYAAQLGMDLQGTDELLRLESPFPPENLLALRLPISAKYSDRERTMSAVVQVIHAMAEAHAGNYLACFPSFAYLNAAYEQYRLCYPNDVVIRQQGGMNEAERAAFIDCFEAEPVHSMVAFVVLGGVFAEGIDLPEEKLSGAAIVSTGLPQISYERDQLRELFDDGFGSGHDVAYVYPGLCRVLQAAGRVIRTENDRGVVLLLDMRYGDEAVRALLPSHWQLRKVGKMDTLRKCLEIFWRDSRSEND